jgi:hypothetical protein
MRLWKWIGVAGLAGVAATGAVVARNERQRRAYTPDDVRSRLHERAAAIEHDIPDPAPTPADQGLRARIRRRLHLLPTAGRSNEPPRKLRP